MGNSRLSFLNLILIQLSVLVKSFLSLNFLESQWQPQSIKGIIPSSKQLHLMKIKIWILK